MASCPRLHSTTLLQAGRSSLPQRWLESDAGRCCGVVRRHSGGFLLRIMPPSWHPVPACTPRLRCRRAILRCRNDGAAAILDFKPRLANRCSQKVKSGAIHASILDFKLRLANRCSQEVKSGAIRASILDFKPRLGNRCQRRGQNGGNPCSSRAGALCRSRSPCPQADSDSGTRPSPVMRPLES